jgi:ketosteroid isomerase-like protein
MQHGGIMRIVAALSLVGLCFSVSGIQAQSNNDEKELRKIEGETARLEQQNDTALAKFLADDWVCACARGLSKKEFIENVKHNFEAHENGPSPYTLEKKNMKVHLFGDTAVVTYIKEYRQAPDTTKFFDEDDTDVFTRDASGWHLRLTKISPVPPQTASN